MRVATRVPLFLVCLLGGGASALPLQDGQYAFTLDVPAGFVRLEQEPGSLHSFRREATAEVPWAVLALRAIPRTLSQTEKLDPDHRVAESGAVKGAAQSGATVLGFRYREVSWQGFPLEVMIMRAQPKEGPEVISYSTMMPLATGTLTVQLVGEAREEAKLTSEFDALLGSVKAESSWSHGTSLNDVGRWGERLGFAVGLGIVLVLTWRRVARPA